MMHKRFLHNLRSELHYFGFKILNKNCFSPLAINQDMSLRELDSRRLFNLPAFTMHESLPDQQLEDLFLELIFESKRALKCDVLNTNPKNLKTIIGRMLRDLQGQVKPEVKKITIIGSDLEIVEEPFQQLLSGFEFVEFIESDLFKSQIALIPKDREIGSFVTFSNYPTKFGMFIYEEYVKKLEFYSDDDLRIVLDQLNTDLEMGEL